MKQLLQNPLVRVLVVIAVVAVGAVGWWLGSPLFLDDEIDEAFPLSATAIVPDDMTQEEVESEMKQAAETPVVMEDEPMPAEPTELEEPSGPIALLTGSFQGADDFHRGSGTATVYELEDGSNVLRFEDFEVTNGPDLHVLLVPNDSPADRDDLTGYVDLGKLKGNVGNQNYEIPPDIDMSEFGSIVIYCEPFHVLFAAATLTT
ncbi:MAG: DM13 domain-containing protein [Acidimicrobiia bacterium]|nr:DM13 domain-containing protein [Acidimicrobiia bacterium]